MFLFLHHHVFPAKVVFHQIRDFPSNFWESLNLGLNIFYPGKFSLKAEDNISNWDSVDCFLNSGGGPLKAGNGYGRSRTKVCRPAENVLSIHKVFLLDYGKSRSSFTLGCLRCYCSELPSASIAGAASSIMTSSSHLRASNATPSFVREQIVWVG